MKTIIQFCDTSNLWPVYFIAEGDYLHLDKVIINSIDTPENLQEEATDLIFDPHIAGYKIPSYDNLPIDKFDEQTIFIRIGFYA